MLGGKVIDGLYRGFDIFSDSFKGQAERIDGTFETFEQVDAHELPDASFTTAAGESYKTTVFALFHIFLQLARQDEIGRCVDGEVQFRHTDENIVEADRRRQIREFWSTGDRFQSFRELADVGGIVVLLDVLALAGNGNAVKDFKEIEAQHFE